MKKFMIFGLILGAVYGGDIDFDTLSSDFKQSVESDGKAIMYSGNFIAEAKNAFWHYAKPSVKNIYFYGDEVVVVEPDLEQAIYTKLKDTPDLGAILRSAKKVSENRYEAVFDGIKYKVSLKNELPYEVKYRDKLENEVTITLSNVKKNVAIKDKGIFKPVIPQGYDIVTN